MKTVWLHGLDDQKVSDLKQRFKECIIVRKRFFELVIKMIEEGRKESSSKAMLDSPNWALQQADRMGYERALRDMLELFSD